MNRSLLDRHDNRNVITMTPKMSLHACNDSQTINNKLISLRAIYEADINNCIIDINITIVDIKNANY